MVQTQQGGQQGVQTVGVPQMLFLNQVTLNGQTSFVLVDANNKPVPVSHYIKVKYTGKSWGGIDKVG
jgi:acyl-CoA thioesterase FadM